MTKLQDYRSGAPRIAGSTTINHEIRVQLQLNCSEYVLLDHLSRKQDKHELADTLSVYIQTGFTEKNQELLFKGLIGKGFIYLEGDNNFTVTDKWYDVFSDIEKEFNQHFWLEMDKKGNRKTAWTGTKKKALEYYIKLRKKYSCQYLADQRRYYFEYLKLENQRGFDRQRMMGQVFLNPGNERFAEDWKDYCLQLKIKLGIVKKEEKADPITIDIMREAYGKNTNQ